jgi:inner membrane protein
LDNITHSLFGYALGRACARFGGGAKKRSSDPPEPLETALVASSVIASNAPDLDFVTGLFGDDRRMVYLLEHRGFTHTLVFAVALGLSVGFGCALFSKLRARRERLVVCAIGAAACLLHIAFDFLNDYGVHPFFPFDNHWYYGDSVFIVEPLLIAVLLPLPMLFAWTRAGRVIARVLALGLILLVWLAGLAVASAVGTTVVLFLSWMQQRQFGSRAAPALAASAMVVAMFAIGSKLARADVHDTLLASTPGERVLDIASSPVPANPTCYRAMVVSFDRNGTYRARIAKVGLLGAASCTLLQVQPTAPLMAAEIRGSRTVQFESMFAASASELAELAASKCDAAAMLRFVRVPFWFERPDGTLLGDLRYDRGPALEFAERLLTGICNGERASGSPWEPPRADLLAKPVR